MIDHSSAASYRRLFSRNVLTMTWEMKKKKDEGKLEKKGGKEKEIRGNTMEVAY